MEDAWSGVFVNVAESETIEASSRWDFQILYYRCKRILQELVSCSMIMIVMRWFSTITFKKVLAHVVGFHLARAVRSSSSKDHVHRFPTHDWLPHLPHTGSPSHDWLSLTTITHKVSYSLAKRNTLSSDLTNSILTGIHLRPHHHFLPAPGYRFQ